MELPPQQNLCKVLLRSLRPLYGDREEFERWAPEVGLALSYHLRDRPLKDPDNEKLLRMLRRYLQRGDLLWFLEEPEVEPTNNRVERALRLAVIARKVYQCSKTWPWADAFAAFANVIQTLLKKGTPSTVVEAPPDPPEPHRYSNTSAAFQIPESISVQGLSGSARPQVTTRQRIRASVRAAWGPESLSEHLLAG